MGETSLGPGAGRLTDCGAAVAGCDRSPAVALLIQGLLYQR